jgi:hypothetical protein
MKILLYSTLIIIFLTEIVNATPKVQAGIFNQGCDVIIKAKPDANITTEYMPAAIVTIKYLTSYNINITTPVSTFGLQLYQTLTNSGYTYKIYQTASGSGNYNWTANVEYEILRITVSGEVGIGNFEIANDQFIISNNCQWYIEHSVLGDITDYITPLYHQNVSGVPLPVIQNSPELPEYFDISQNYPNPFNPVTNIDFQLPSDSKVTVRIYDILGKEILSLVDDNLKAGYYNQKFDASNISSGTYFYRITAEGIGQKYVMTKKMIIVK